jgi:hypothetical protein
MIPLTAFAISLLLFMSTVVLSRNHATPGATDAEIQNEAVKIFHTAHDRHGGPRRCQNKAAQKLQTSTDVSNKPPSLPDCSVYCDLADEETVEK